MGKSVEMPTKAMMTMAVDDDNPVPFQPVPPSKTHKKVKLNPAEVVEVQHKFKIDLHITFTQKGHSGSKFNVASHAKKLFSAMLHHDNSITVKTAMNTVSIANEPFLNHEEQF